MSTPGPTDNDVSNLNPNRPVISGDGGNPSPGADQHTKFDIWESLPHLGRDCGCRIRGPGLIYTSELRNTDGDDSEARYDTEYACMGHRRRHLQK